MGVLTRAADLVYTYQFLRLLTMKWTDTDAYKLGIVGKNGEQLKKASQLKTSEEKDAYTLFVRLVFNIKRIIDLAPGPTPFINIAAALYLLKDNYNISDKYMLKIFEKVNLDLTQLIAEENKWYVLGDNSLSPGAYTLTTNAASPKTGEIIARAGTRVMVDENTIPVGVMLDQHIYRIRHIQTKQEIYVSSRDIMK